MEEKIDRITQRIDKITESIYELINDIKRITKRNLILIWSMGAFFFCAIILMIIIQLTTISILGNMIVRMDDMIADFPRIVDEINAGIRQITEEIKRENTNGR